MNEAYLNSFESSFRSEHTPLLNNSDDIFLQDYESSKNNTYQQQQQQQQSYNQEPQRNTLRRNMKFRHGFAFVVGCIIGAGIFISPSLVARRTPNLFLALVAWIMAGGLALMGALCYCEMVSLVRKTGASYVFVLDCYGKAAGFMVNWSNALIFAPCDSCLLVITIGLYTCAPFFNDHESSEYLWCSKIAGILVMFAIVVINCLGAKKSGTFQIAFISIQMLVFGAIIGMGIYSGATTESIHNLAPDVVFNNTLEGLRNDFPSFGIALFNALYCFDGYVTIAYIVEEVVEPSKTIPAITFTSIPFITFVYIIVNLAYSAVLTHSEIAASDVVVSDLALKVGGKVSSYFVPAFVAISVLPALSAVFYNLPRMVMSSAREGQFPSVFSLIHRERRTPIPAIIYLAIATIILTLMDISIQTLLQCCNISIWFEYALAVSTILVNRYRKPYAYRTYTTWITTPILIIIIPVIMFVLVAIEKPLSTFTIVFIMLLSFPVYYVCLYRRWAYFIPTEAVNLWFTRRFLLVKCEKNELSL